MSIHLVGGGWSVDDDGAVYREFLAEAKVRSVDAGRLEGPRVAIVLVHDGLGPEAFSKYVATLELVAPLDPVAVLAPEGSPIDAALFADVDGILVGGGLTPAYRASLEPAFATIRGLVESGVPYLGFSAGAAIASDHALVGGYRIGGVQVAPEDTAEDLDEVTVGQGIGLIDIAVDAHAAQWGTLGRLVAAAEAGIVDGGVAIDEFTALIVGNGALRVVGTGSVWKVTTVDGTVRVSTMGATE